MSYDKNDTLFEKLFAKAVREYFENELAELIAMEEKGYLPEYTFSERHNEMMRKLFEIDSKTK